MKHTRGFLIILLIFLNVLGFSQNNEEKFEIARAKIEQTLDAIGKDKIEIPSFTIVTNVIRDIFTHEKYERYDLFWESFGDGRGVTTLIFYDDAGSEIGNFSLWFGITYVPNTFTYLAGVVVSDDQEYYVSLSDDSRKDERKKPGFREYNSLWLKFSYSDTNSEDFAFFTIYYTDGQELINIRKYKNVYGFLETQIIERITRYRYE
ncbi:MAG: hypothetical protein HN368_13400 [Spirochaetales bacterium]|nr:hypothetical protein [Spirochaetales bacterium]